MAELNRSKPIATPFPKFNPRDVEIFIIEAETWFKFNQVYEQSRMINHMGAQLEGNAREWWTSKLRIDRAREGRLFNDWHYFTERLTEQFNPRNARMEAYNKLLALRLTSGAPGVATRHVERFRDLEGQVNLDDNELVIDLFRGSLTRSLQEKFERNPPNKRWEWYQEVEEIDRQRMLLQQASARHSQANNASSPGTRPIQSSIPVWQSAAHPYSTRSPAQPYQPSQSYLARPPTQNRSPPHQPTPAPKGTPAPSGGSNNTCHVCKGIGHWARDCPSRRVDSLGSRPMGPKVMVVTKDPFDEATDSGDGHSGNTEPEQEDMDLRPYQQHMDSDHEDEQDDDDDEGNVRKAVLELSGMVQDHPARILADTGAGLSIVSDSFISKYQIPTKPTKTRSIHGVTGHQLSINSSASMQVSIGTHNLGVVEASVADTADYDLILGFTELWKLKPTIRWDTGQLEFKTQEQDRPPRRPPEAAGAEALSMKSPTLHGNEFVSAERILQAALEDGPIGFMLLEVVRGLAPETRVGLSGYSVTIKLCDSYCLGIGLGELRRSATIKLRDDSGWRSLDMLS
ncbi:related to retrotransposon nucleocapsid protein [Ustilago sp. UG-2017b]|nr:related to retrotransposon nucleocapsid protein [Ustilago sp. UG-2017b]